MTADASARADEVRGLPGWLRPLAEMCSQATATGWRELAPPAGSDPRRASVLVLLGEGAEGPQVLLLERAHDMRSHAGQVAFPGGAQDLDDADEVAAALREAQEETGVDPRDIDVIGTLPRIWLRPSNFAVTAVVGWWHRPGAVHAVDPAETASVHTITIAELLEPANRVRVRHPSGFTGPAFCVGDRVVWGFTAGLLARIFATVGWDRPWDTSRVVELPTSLRDPRGRFDR